MTTTIQLKRGISTDWTTNNPVLAAGEVGIETDTNKIKIGNGSTAWTSLEYFSGNSGSGTSNYNELSNQPQINNVTLTGNKSLEDLGITTGGNWVKTNSITLYSGGNTTPQTISLADYLPAGYSLYEVILVTQVVAVAPLDSYTDIQVSTQYGNYSLGACKCTNANMANALVTTVTIPVGADRTITLVGNSNDNGSCTITLRSYRHGTLTSGGSATAYTDLTNKPSINGVTLTGDKTSEDLGFMSNANFLPANHEITVATDGSGDFTSLVDAVNYLRDKYSNGQIRIHVLSGTYAINGYINLDGTLGNISKIIIYGDGIDNTILNFTNIPSYTGAINIKNISTFVVIRDLTVVNQDTEKSNRIGIGVKFAPVSVENCKTVNFTEGITSTQAVVRIINKVTINDCTSAIVAYAGGRICTDYGVQLDFTNCTYGLNVSMGSTVALTYVQRVFNNVTNLTNITMGSITANGYIGGEWHT